MVSKERRIFVASRAIWARIWRGSIEMQDAMLEAFGILESGTGNNNCT
jgi:hypothetical protein